MGSERLNRRGRGAALALFAALVGAVVAGCGGRTERSPRAAVHAARHHVQIVNAMKAPERRALVERFRRRNPTRDGERWSVNDEALVASVTVVDPFARFLRRARLERVPTGGSPSGRAHPAVDADRAVAIARAFVKDNADLLGVPRAVTAGLAERVRAASPRDHASPLAAWAVRLDAPFPTRGYEAFRELDNVADVEVFVDLDGTPSSFVNLSRVHPPVALDTTPGLAYDDPRLLAKLVGRTVFAVVDDGHADLHSRRVLTELRRIPLGVVYADDVRQVKVIVHVSPGPQLAWMTYRLGYFVEVAKVLEPAPDDPPDRAPQVFFFRYVVDADTGDVLEDARVPVTPEASLAPSR